MFIGVSASNYLYSLSPQGLSIFSVWPLALTDTSYTECPTFCTPHPLWIFSFDHCDLYSLCLPSYPLFFCDFSSQHCTHNNIAQDIWFPGLWCLFITTHVHKRNCMCICVQFCSHKLQDDSLRTISMCIVHTTPAYSLAGKQLWLCKIQNICHAQLLLKEAESHTFFWLNSDLICVKQSPCQPLIIFQINYQFTYK